MSTLRKNPFAYDKPITLDTLGDLFAYHSARFAGWTMEDDDEKEAAEKAAADKAAADKAAADKAAADKAFEPITSQEDLDRALGKRLAREREKFADYDELKKKAAEHDKALEAQKTEHEKAVDAARKEGETTALERANTRLVKSEARALAAAAKFRDPADAVAFLDLTKVSVNDDGDVDEAAIKDQLKTLAESKPYLVDDGKKPPPKPDRSQGGGGKPDATSTVAKGREAYAARHQKKSA